MAILQILSKRLLQNFSTTVKNFNVTGITITSAGKSRLGAPLGTSTYISELAFQRDNLYRNQHNF